MDNDLLRDTLVPAGGLGERLYPLTQDRIRGAGPGLHRLIGFGLYALMLFSPGWDGVRGEAHAESQTLIQQRKRQWIQDEQRRERELSESERQLFSSSVSQGVTALRQTQLDDAIRLFLNCLSLDPDDYLTRWRLGVSYLRIGQFAEAEAVFRLMVKKVPELADAWYSLGVALMRMNRFDESIQPFEKALDLAPDYLEASWNLMMACQQAGKDPKTLEGQYQLSLAPWLFPSHQPVRFTEVGPQAGVALVNLGRASAWRDLDHDGWLDLFTVAEGSSHALFHNDRDGTFTNITRQAGMADSRGGWSALWIDYDNDSAPDFFVTRNAWNGRGTNSLYHNNGNGTFTDLTQRAGLESDTDSFCAAWGDYDSDGWLDLYVANGISQGGWPNYLYHNNADGTFAEVAIQAGVDNDLRRTVGVAWGDYDSDGRLDLYAVNFGDRNALYRNKGNGTFAEVTWEARVAEPYQGFVTFFFDYDNDGWLDLFVSNWAEQMEEVIRSMIAGEPTLPNQPALYHNNGNGTFTNVTRQAGLARTFGTMAATFGDVDNDGYQDLYLANGGPPMDRFEPARLFLNNGDGTFAEVTEFAGVGNLGKGHGTTMADYDNDGDLDIYAPQGGMGANPGDKQPNSLYRNEGNQNHWLSVELVGGMGAAKGGRGGGAKVSSQNLRLSNRDGVGAKVRVKVGGTIRCAEVIGGCGFGVTNSLRQHFGLGAVARVDTVEVRWPSGLVDRVTGVPADRMLTIREAGKTTVYGGK